jgi:hypothetical protein
MTTTTTQTTKRSKQRWQTLFLVAPVVLAAGCGPAEDSTEKAPEPTGQVQQAESFFDKLDNDKKLQQALKLGGKIMSIYSGIGTGITTVQTLGQLLGLFPEQESEVERLMRENFAQLHQELRDVLGAQLGQDYLDRLARAEGIVADGTGAAFTARQWVYWNNEAYPESEAQTALINSKTAIDKFTFPGAQFQRVWINEDTINGEDTWTDGVRTVGEWKQVISKRPAVSNGTVFDWRFGAPAMANVLTSRVAVLNSVWPDWPVNAPGRGDELLGYRDTLWNIYTHMESNIDCGFSLWAVHGDTGTFVLKAICADTATGMTSIIERQGRITASAALNSTGQCGQLWCGGDHWIYNDMPINLNNNLTQYPWGQYRTEFWRYAEADSEFSDLVRNGLHDARQELRIKMGFFELTVMMDRLYALRWNYHVPQDSGGKIRSGIGSNKCLDMDPLYLQLTGGGAMSDGNPFVLNDCAAPVQWWTQPWAFQPDTGEIINVAYALWAGQRWCMDVSWASTRVGQTVWTWPCNGGDAQRWSWDPEYEELSNARGTVLDVEGWSSANMTRIQTWDVHYGANQQWRPY